MSEEHIAQVATGQAVSTFTAGAIGESNHSSPDLLSPLNDGRTSLANLNEREVELIRLLRDMYQDYLFFELNGEAEYCLERITTIVETSKARRGTYLSTIISKQLKIDVGAGTPSPHKTWRTKPNYQEER